MNSIEWSPSWANDRSAASLRVTDILLCAYIFTAFGNQLNTAIDQALRYITLALYVTASLLQLLDDKTKNAAGKRYWNTFVIWLFLFWLYCYLSYFWAADKSYLVHKWHYFVRAINILAVVPFIVYQTKSRRDLLRLFEILVLANLYSACILIYRTPLNDWGNVRVGLSIGVDRNTLGMRLSFASLFAVLLFSQTRKSKYLAFAPIMMAISGMTGSRKGALILFLGLLIYGLISSKGLRFFRNIILTIIILYGLYHIIMTNEILYSILGSRINNLLYFYLNRGGVGDFSATEREWFRSYAIEMWKDRPFLGWGFVGFEAQMYKISYRNVAYSHCNYTELLATLGILGFVIYYIFYLHLFRSLVRIMSGSDRLISFATVLLITNIVIEYGLVSFVEIDVYIYLCIIYSITQICSNKYYEAG